MVLKQIDYWEEEYFTGFLSSQPYRQSYPFIYCKNSLWERFRVTCLARVHINMDQLSWGSSWAVFRWGSEWWWPSKARELHQLSQPSQSHDYSKVLLVCLLEEAQNEQRYDKGEKLQLATHSQEQKYVYEVKEELQYQNMTDNPSGKWRLCLKRHGEAAWKFYK